MNVYTTEAWGGIAPSFRAWKPYDSVRLAGCTPWMSLIVTSDADAVVAALETIEM